MNVFAHFQFAILNLAKFMMHPGRIHHAAAAAHLPSHLCHNPCAGALTCCSDLSKASVKLLTLLMASVHRPASH
jgi:hypothetical protein